MHGYQMSNKDKKQVSSYVFNSYVFKAHLLIWIEIFMFFVSDSRDEG